MTTSVNRVVDTQVLYLAVDLGETPRFGHFAEQVGCLEILQRYSRALVEPADTRTTSGLPHTQHDVTELFEALDSLSLPNAQRHLLNELLKAEEPGSPLHRPPVTEATEIRIVRTSLASPWVTVMADLARSSQPVAYGLTALLGLHRLMRMIMEWQTHRQELAERRDALSRSQLLSLLAQHEDAVSPGTTVADEARHDAATAIARLDPVVAADMLDPEDPRATPSP